MNISLWKLSVESDLKSSEQHADFLLQLSKMLKYCASCCTGNWYFHSVSISTGFSVNTHSFYHANWPSSLESCIPQRALVNSSPHPRQPAAPPPCSPLPGNLKQLLNTVLNPPGRSWGWQAGSRRLARALPGTPSLPSSHPELPWNTTCPHKVLPWASYPPDFPSWYSFLGTAAAACWNCQVDSKHPVHRMVLSPACIQHWVCHRANA